MHEVEPARGTNTIGHFRAWRITLVGWALLVGWAFAFTGCFASVGPMIGYAPGRGPSVGLEATGGAAGLAQLAVGATRRPASPDALDDRPLIGEVVAYAAWEPWLVIGGTLGGLYSSETGLHGLLGLWEGAPVWGGLYGNSRSAPWSCSSTANLKWMMTVSVGVHRWEVSAPWRQPAEDAPEGHKPREQTETDFYVSPKFGVLCPDLGNTLP